MGKNSILNFWGMGWGNILYCNFGRMEGGKDGRREG